MKRILPVVWILCGLLATTAWADLTGRWSCNDGGTYYLREHEGQLYWYGEAKGVPPRWANVFTGHLAEGRIVGSWADVPKGRATGAGTLELVVGENGDRLRAVKRSAGFRGTRWTRLDDAAHASAPLAPAKPAADQDCVRFDPMAAGVQQVSGRWKITTGSHWLFDLGKDANAAHRALAVIRHYRMDRVCFIGRPKSSFTYLLAKGGVPIGAMAGEDCVAFDPVRMQVSKVQNRWRLVSDRRWLWDFGKNESQAQEALALIQRHRFNQVCYVGRPKADFTYLRR
ncbi:exported hypothetical protein [Desulfosarcina cetonica]|uniref:hypothetical protein n=1 Tax=Desulfosarcina cetonica TaxID=90730 RepID=UPI0006CFE9EE|nr:hypothetical protein [Desulfosarcina cetonica]VTR69926.1 exported hypothetical protein [Desulfosarcina cetonica]